MAETLASLAPLPIWVKWSLHPTRGKVPYSPWGGRPAATNDPSTWADLITAERSHGGKPGAEGGIGIILTELPCGLLLCGVDLDTCVEGTTVESWAHEIIIRFNTYTEISPSGTGVKLLFLVARETVEAFRRSSGTTVWRLPQPNRHAPAIELYTGGRYFTITGRRVGEVEEIRELTLADLEWLARDAAPRFLGKIPLNGKNGGETLEIIKMTIEDLLAAFLIIPNQEVGWEEWNNKGMAIWAVSEGSEEGYEVFRTWSERAQCYDARETRERWDHWRRSPPRMMSAITVVRWVRDNMAGWVPPSWRTTAASPPFSDDWLALRFIDDHVVDVRYTAAWGQWHHWDGQRWSHDERGRVASWGRFYLREVARESNKKRNQLASHSTLANVVRMAQVDQRITTGTSTWDRDPWLIATPSGTVDLRTGKLDSGEPSDYITKLTAAGPGGVCPRWMKFLGEALDANVVAFMKRVAGYSLTGLTREEKLFFLHGSGGNGKGTFIETLRYVMGDYATTVAMATLIQQKHQEHPTEIAKLRGVRLAVAHETEEGSRWNANRIKDLTGGDALTARFMRQDFFDFNPTHKLVMSGNRKPLLGRVEDAIRRRMVFLGFLKSFLGREDLTLKEQLRSEASGILGWAIEGCMEWQRVGLAIPESVRAATEEYLHDQDDMQVWIDECCFVDKRASASTADLFQSWSDWCGRNGGYVGSRKVFTEGLKVKFESKVGKGNALFIYGLAVEGGLGAAAVDGSLVAPIIRDGPDDY